MLLTQTNRLGTSAFPSLLRFRSIQLFEQHSLTRTIRPQITFTNFPEPNTIMNFKSLASFVAIFAVTIISKAAPVPDQASEDGTALRCLDLCFQERPACPVGSFASLQGYCWSCCTTVEPPHHH
ncbi:hypothetical protein P691DRAFT_574280 [Macrolepiota fuliginosa MF-IS2]|uniref:Uncharacterized protein n=1 Tax=Macrolepiota fuliginosa MF-IS2 TaxID=1400762 RepID=A0A9P6C275_9AGAR|nr:hypothetical protein P691DRAFT_574280 [Macrolepiota fuliginosa MF-IS2]